MKYCSRKKHPKAKKAASIVMNQVEKYMKEIDKNICKKRDEIEEFKIKKEQEIKSIEKEKTGLNQYLTELEERFEQGKKM